ncbi:MAG: SurA N-terminal domain-containing protein, partial [Hydrogenobacter sp.]
MYALIQKHKTLAVLIVALASGAFFLWLFFTGSIRDITSVGKKCVAEVNGSCITLREYRRELLRFSNIQNKELEEIIKKQVIDNLITQELLYQKAKSLGYSASDEEVISVIKSDPTFQEGGSFSASKYKELLSRLGLVPEEYEDYIRKMLTIQKLLALVSNGVYLSDKEKEVNLAVQSTLLSGRLYILTPSDVELSYNPTQEEIL